MAQKLIQGDMRKIDPETEHNLFLYGKVPWVVYSEKKFKNRKEEFEAKYLHVECKKWKGENLLELLRSWRKSGMAEKRFGEHIRIVEVLKP